MNNRDYKNFSQNEIYHVYNRGSNKMDIFHDKHDYQIFINRIFENVYPDRIGELETPKHALRRRKLTPGSFDLISYCLMPNHFHLLVKQNAEIGINHLISKVCTGYSKYFNKKYKRVGPIFQDKFKAVRVAKNNQLVWTSYYIHTNPVKANICTHPRDYIWSSYKEYENNIENSICNKNIILDQYNSIEAYLDTYKDRNLQFDIQNKLISNLDLLIDENLQ